jgi:hypothetical protein
MPSKRRKAPALLPPLRINPATMHDVPLERRAAMVICDKLYPASGCGCVRSLDKPACQQMVEAAQLVIDMVRNEGDR